MKEQLNEIPCVVGTHAATKALKNGDKILIDMNAGIIHKKHSKEEK
ncbi:MAG: hypothetical protein UT66_C0018G0009 [candidate division CPR2 bacterium GW2011_GWC1_39_9]|uniref:PEP-utilising enzyme mobile domain-containing protein n=1 Tax=candidate division CPR2 bacterium GW2011_GWC2_39_10 TaxID=1618345 RepID=A0A0G0LPZ6_UNCC2|nr:MAG: hypothetical protein UT18_C0013G0025 [candidate division CPR2 bacterium GW2011_GWC2_39_10]KKR34670.1 MAG: hypothetical protein UT66_C0018G0009 [candidate division CPR2 bacterium GW2011_GWC1_39_9]